MDTTSLTEAQALGVAGIAGATVLFVLLFTLATYALTIIAGWKIIQKAGEPGWKILIPIYNTYTLFKIVDMKEHFWIVFGLSIFISVVSSVSGLSNYDAQAANATFTPAMAAATVVVCVASIATTIISIMQNYRLSKVFGHGIGFTLGLIFFPFIFQLILGFGNSKYDKKRLK